MASWVTYTRAMVVRSVFCVHGSLMIVATVLILGHTYLLALFAPIGIALLSSISILKTCCFDVAVHDHEAFLIDTGALAVETVVTLTLNEGHEYKWMSPCIALYTLSVVPAVWFQQLRHNANFVKYAK